MKKNTLLLVFLLTVYVTYGQEKADDSSVIVYPCTQFSVSRPLIELMESENIVMESSEPWFAPDKEHRLPQHFQFSAEDGPEYGNDPATIQSQQGRSVAIPVLTSWLGLGAGQCPPDPSGSAGLNHYVQTCNTNPFKIFDKTTGTQIGIVQNIQSLWTPTANLCCDPIVLYDKYADRWVLTALNNGTTAYIAVSTSPDPTGTYYTYSFSGLPSDFYDYPKLSIWADGYYLTYNLYNSDRIFCYERPKLIIGDSTARLVNTTFNPGNGNYTSFWAPLPADADGQLPPAGSPLPFFAFSDNAWGGGNIDGVKIWTLAIDWIPAIPATTITQLPPIPTAAFDASYHPTWLDVPQPGSGQRLDGVGGIVMYRAQWRKWVGFNTVLLNWGVKISESPRQRAIKWVELRQNQSDSTWSLYQEGIYNPFPAASEWMGSIAMDDSGSIALCYSKSDSAGGIYPSLAFTARLKTDPLGVMTFGETIAEAGTTPSTSCSMRYGDYSHTSMDPDGITFWHTGCYVSSGIKTRIYSFRIPYTVSVAENEKHTSFSVTQMGNTLNVKGSNILSSKEMVVDLFDREGRMINGRTVNPAAGNLEASIDVANVAKGAYLVRIGNTDFQKVIKVMID
jgi:hypothetical protein